jgi:hypothetical protein
MIASSAVKFEFVFAAIALVLGLFFLYRGDSSVLANSLVTIGAAGLLAAIITLIRERANAQNNANGNASDKAPS